MSVSITYTKSDGSKAKAKFTNDVTKIRIDHEDIINIDLSPLSMCHDLRDLSFAQVSFSELDLSPISSCTNLERFELEETHLKTIDLTPLASCKNLENLNISLNPIQSIDLSPLAACTRLKEFKVNHNQIPAIDLQPLAGCENLESIDLFGNKLMEIDLSSLSSCRNLTKLAVPGNPLKHINLAPLTSAQNLEELILFECHLKNIDLSPLSSLLRLNGISLFNNELEFINLSPLSSCRRLQNLKIFGNPIKKIDLTPLVAFTDWRELLLNPSAKTASWLKSLDVMGPEQPPIYERPSCIYPWSFLHWVIKEHGIDFRVQQDVLVAMGLREYGFIDMDLRDLLLSIPSEKDLEKAREQVIPRLVEKIIETVDNDGSTIGLDIEKVGIRHPEIAAIIPKIVELRKHELEKITVESDSNGWSLDLRKLWLTAYGYEVLSTAKEEVFEKMPSQFRTNPYQFEIVKQAFVDIGVELRIGKESVIKIGEPLKKAIWWIIENEQKPWKEIEPVDSQSFHVYGYYGRK